MKEIYFKKICPWLETRFELPIVAMSFVVVVYFSTQTYYVTVAVKEAVITC